MSKSIKCTFHIFQAIQKSPKIFKICSTKSEKASCVCFEEVTFFSLHLNQSTTVLRQKYLGI